MYTQHELDDKWSTMHFHSTFEPTLNAFKNGLLVNYKKVGTRFIGQLLSLPNDVSDNKIQMDLIITKNPLHIGSFVLDTTQYEIKYEYGRKFCYTEFDDINSVNRPNQKYIKYSNSNEFLKYCEVENYNELFFNNKKDIIFLVRNPIHRFYSGLIQILYSVLYELPTNENLKKEIIFYTALTSSELEKVCTIMSNLNITEKDISFLKKNEIELLISFIIEKQWNLILQDIHTDNYLFNYVEWIHHIKDKSKIKIIDLKDCLSNKSLDFFTNLMGNNLLKTQFPNSPNQYTYWEWMYNQTGTNKLIYKIVINKLLQSNSNFSKKSAMEYYLRNEYEIYDSLIKYPYYIDLKD